MPRALTLLFALLVVVAASPTTARSLGASPPGFAVVAKSDLYNGVEYLKLAKAKVPVVAHVAHVRPGAPVDLRIVNANDKISTGTNELETTSSMCRRVRCIAGLNGDFVRAGEPTGAVIVDGRMLHSPDPAFPQLTVTGDGRLLAGPLPWTASLTVADGQQIAVNAVNTAAPGDGIVLYTPAFGARTDVSARTELVVKAPGSVGSLNQPTDLELRGIRSGAGPIPADGAVLSAGGAAAQQLLDVWARRQAGMPGRARLLVSSPVDARTSLGAEPVVLRDGRRALPWRDPNLVHPRQPHTLVGWNKAGDIFLVAVDGRQPASEGVTMAEAADFLLGLGATDAVNLDGGGGTTFVAGGSVWNRPSDNDPARPAVYEERGTANAFVLTAPDGALPPEAPLAPAPVGASPPPPPRKDSAAPRSVPPQPSLDGGPSLESVWGHEWLADGELPVGPMRADPGFRPGAASTPPVGVDQVRASADGEPPQIAPTGGPDKQTGGGPGQAVTRLPASMEVASAVGRVEREAGDDPSGMRSTVVIGTAALAAALTLTAARRGRRGGSPRAELPRAGRWFVSRPARPAQRSCTARAPWRTGGRRGR
jgi:hypothetical protein